MFLFYSLEHTEDQLILLSDEHLHCTTVLRKKIGDTVFVTNGSGSIFKAEIHSIEKKQTICSILETQTQSPLFPEIAIAIAPTKNASRIEWFLEKATEFGISAIYLTQTKRTERKSTNIQRLEKILISAMKQSLNTHLPTLQSLTYTELLDLSSEKYEQKFIAHCDNPDLSLKNLYDPTTSALLLIGPEGDFTPDEINQAIQSGFKACSLGDMRLRTETAGLVGLFTLRYPRL